LAEVPPKKSPFFCECRNKKNKKSPTAKRLKKAQKNALRSRAEKEKKKAQKIRRFSAKKVV